MADDNITPEMIEKILGVIRQQQIVLRTFAALGAVREGGQPIADYMRDWVKPFCKFTPFERALILKFMVETEEAIQKLMKEHKEGGASVG